MCAQQCDAPPVGGGPRGFIERSCWQWKGFGMRAVAGRSGMGRPRRARPPPTRPFQQPASATQRLVLCHEHPRWRPQAACPGAINRTTQLTGYRVTQTAVGGFHRCGERRFPAAVGPGGPGWLPTLGSHRSGRACINASGSSADSFTSRGRSLWLSHRVTWTSG